MNACQQDGCLGHVSLGDTIHRTSPKGGPFHGLCTEHFRRAGGTPDPVTEIIERANIGRVQ